MSAHLVEKAQALDDAVVEIDQPSLGQLVNVNRHNGTIDESRAGASACARQECETAPKIVPSRGWRNPLGYSHTEWKFSGVTIGDDADLQ